MEIGHTVKIQKIADLLVADIAALQQLARFFHFQAIDILHRRKSGQLSEPSAIDTFTQGALPCQLRNAELFCEMAVDVANAVVLNSPEQ